MLNRRTFLIASGMTALASTRAWGANDKLRIGVIGAGHRMKGLLDSADAEEQRRKVELHPDVIDLRPPSSMGSIPAREQSDRGATPISPSSIPTPNARSAMRTWSPSSR